MNDVLAKFKRKIQSLLYLAKWLISATKYLFRDVDCLVT